MSAVRIHSFTVAVHAVLDDGEQLTPLDVQPITYAARDAAAFDLDHVRGLLQRQIDEQTAQPNGQAPVEADETGEVTAG